MTKLIKTLLVGALLAFGAQANALYLTPGGSGVIQATITPPKNCEPGCIETAFGLTTGSLTTLLYKADLGAAADSGVFAGSYSTSFDNSPTDPMDAAISYVGGASIVCPICFLAIKDGKQDPNYYFFDLKNWDGKDVLDLQDFWPSNGAISHVSIWGVSGNVPEPGVLGLMGIALLGLGLMRRRAV